jgi:hypothetical protein
VLVLVFAFSFSSSPSSSRPSNSKSSDIVRAELSLLPFLIRSLFFFFCCCCLFRFFKTDGVNDEATPPTNLFVLFVLDEWYSSERE